MKGYDNCNLNKAGILGIFLVCMLLSVFASGRSLHAEEAAEKSRTSAQGTSPDLKEGDPPKRLCVVSYDEYIPFSRQLYYILAGLEETGWIREDSLPFTADGIEKNKIYVDEMYRMLEEGV